MIPITPSSIAIQLGPLPVYWYGICYAVGLAVAYLVMASEARRRGFDVDILANGMIVVAIAALIGGRAYHVIDQWALYKDDLLKIVLPPYSGLGVYGGLATGVLAAVLYARWKRVPFWPWADVIAPGLFAMQAIGRWGNFFNQELYGPPTDLPWGIAIDCAHRVAEYPCENYPLATTGFHPLFLYESISGILGVLALLWLARRYGPRLRNGDLLLIFFIWYPIVRFLLESLRTGNWKVGGIPTAQLVSVVFVLVALLVFLYRHRSGAADGVPEIDPFAEEEASLDLDPYGGDEDWDRTAGDGTDEASDGTDEASGGSSAASDGASGTGEGTSGTGEGTGAPAPPTATRRDGPRGAASPAHEPAQDPGPQPA